MSETPHGNSQNQASYASETLLAGETKTICSIERNRIKASMIKIAFGAPSSSWLSSTVSFSLKTKGKTEIIFHDDIAPFANPFEFLKDLDGAERIELIATNSGTSSIDIAATLSV